MMGAATFFMTDCTFEDTKGSPCTTCEWMPDASAPPRRPSTLLLQNLLSVDAVSSYGTCIVQPTC